MRKSKIKLISILSIITLAIATPVSISLTNYTSKKSKNSKHELINENQNKVLQKVPNFTNLSIYKNTNYGTTLINFSASNSVNSIYKISSSWYQSTNQKLFYSCFQSFNVSSSVPQNINLSNLDTYINNQSSFNISISENINQTGIKWTTNPNQNWFFTNNSVNVQTQNSDGNAIGLYGPTCYSNTITYTGLNSSGDLIFQQSNTSPLSLGAHSTWPGNGYTNGITISYSTNINLILPFNMNTIYTNIQNAISAINLPHYEFESTWNNAVINQIQQIINGCIPSYMSNVFNINSFITNYGTAGNIQTIMNYTAGNGELEQWTFNTAVTMPSQPSNLSAYNLFENQLTAPITLESNTSNAWDSNKYWNSATLPTGITNPKVWSYIKQGNAIYYNGLNSNNETWCTNEQVLNNYINTIFNNVLNQIQADATIVNPNPFANNPISIQSISFVTLNGTNYIQTILNFNNGNFNNPNNINSDVNPAPWKFLTPVTLSLSQYFYSVNLLNRINIQAVNMPEASTFQTVTDNGYFLQGSNSTSTSGSNNSSGFINAGTWLYYSNATLTFTGSLSEQDTLTINGQAVQVINNQFKYELTAPQVTPKVNNQASTGSNNQNNNNSNNSNNNNSNNTSSFDKTYVIEIYRSGVPIYKKTVVITMGVPSVNFKWYAWNPATKPWQKNLITQTLPNGKANPNYNPLINANTGAINQILWVNEPTPNHEPYYADPLNSNNQPYTTSTVPSGDVGYIADGEVFNKGVTINWNTNNANVYRQGMGINSYGKLVTSSNPTGQSAFNGIGNYQQIQPNGTSTTSYFSYSGLWQYTTLTLYNGKNYLPSTSGIYSYYLIDVIDSNDEQQISKFTNVVKTNSVVPFWSSIHGIHLANYLKNDQNMTQSQIQELDYAQVQYWWNLYCGYTTTKTSSNYQAFDLASCSLNHIVMNTSNVDTILNTIEHKVQNALSVDNLLINVDYQINITKAQLQALANYQNDLNGECTENITVTSKNTNACYGTLNIQVINSINALNLNNVMFGTIDVGVTGNSSSSIATLQKDIIKQVQQAINVYARSQGIKTQFLYNEAWSINWSNIDNLLLSNNKQVALSYLQIYAVTSSLDCYGSNQVLVDNNTSFSNPYNYLNLSYITIPNLIMNLSNSNQTELEVEISNYIFLNINYAFNDYFANNQINPKIEQELIFNWNSSVYSTSKIVYPSTYGIYWTIVNYSNLLQTLTANTTNSTFNNNVTLYIEPTQQGTENLCGTIPFDVDNASTNPDGVSNGKFTYPNISNINKKNHNNSNNSINNKNNNSNKYTTNNQNNNLSKMLDLNNVVFANLQLDVLGSNSNAINTIKTNIINDVTLAINNYANSISFKNDLKYGVNWTINWNNLNNLLLNSHNETAAAYFAIVSITNNGACEGVNNVYVTNNTTSNVNNFSFNLTNINIPNLFMNLRSNNEQNLLANISNYIFDDINQAFNLYLKNNPNDQLASLLTFNWNNKIYQNNKVIYPSNFNQTWTILNYNNLLTELANNANSNNFYNSVVMYVVPSNDKSGLYGAIPFFINNSSSNNSNVTAGKFSFPKNNLVPNSQSNSVSQNKTKSVPGWIIAVSTLAVLIFAVIISAIWIRIKQRKFI